MLRPFLQALVVLPLLLALAGCCGNVACNCRDSLADSLFFSFDPAFSATEADTVYVARYARAGTGRALDSLPISTTISSSLASQLASQITFADATAASKPLFLIGNTAPFSQAGSTTNLSSYTYRLYLMRDGSRTTFYRYVVDNLGLSGSYQADGCCTCYRNSRKQVRVRSVDAAGNPLATLVNGLVTDDNSGSAPRTPQLIRLTK